MIVRITPEAERDLESIGDFIAADNPARAISFLAELRKTCASLAEYPNRFPIVPRFERYDIRKCSHGRYLIYYRVRADTIEVIRILHSAMDTDAIQG